MLNKSKFRKFLRSKSFKVVLIVLPVLAAAGLFFNFHYRRQYEQLKPTGETQYASLKKAFANLDASKLEEGVFKLQYRGVELDTDAYQMLRGIRTNRSLEPMDEFTRSLDLPPKIAVYFKKVNIENAPWAAIEYKWNSPRILYVDLNANGQLDENEKIMPAQNAGKNWGAYGGTIIFQTPDYQRKTEDGNAGAKRYREMLMAVDAAPSEFNGLWSPLCVYEGWGKLEDKPYRLALFDDNTNTAFDGFTEDSYSLLSPTGAKPAFFYSTSLSSLILHDNRFYRISFSEGTAFVRPNKAPLGRVEFKAPGAPDTSFRLSTARFTGAKDASVNFYYERPVTGDVQLPEMEYRIEYAQLEYSEKGEKEKWLTSLSFEPDVSIHAKQDETAVFELANLQLIVKVFKSTDNYHDDKNAKTEFQKGERLLVHNSIIGEASESYTRFSLNTYGDRKYPQVVILDSAGRAIASGVMEYG